MVTKVSFCLARLLTMNPEQYLDEMAILIQFGQNFSIFSDFLALYFKKLLVEPCLSTLPRQFDALVLTLNNVGHQSLNQLNNVERLNHRIIHFVLDQLDLYKQLSLTRVVLDSTWDILVTLKLEVLILNKGIVDRKDCLIYHYSPDQHLLIKKLYNFTTASYLQLVPKLSRLVQHLNQAKGGFTQGDQRALTIVELVCSVLFKHSLLQQGSQANIELNQTIAVETIQFFVLVLEKGLENSLDHQSLSILETKLFPLAEKILENPWHFSNLATFISMIPNLDDHGLSRLIVSLVVNQLENLNDQLNTFRTLPSSKRPMSSNRLSTAQPQGSQHLISHGDGLCSPSDLDCPLTRKSPLESLHCNETAKTLKMVKNILKTNDQRQALSTFLTKGSLCSFRCQPTLDCFATN